MILKIFKNFREHHQQLKLKKQYQQEQMQQCNLELKVAVSKLEDPNVSKEDAHAAFNAWLDKWLND